MPEQPAGLITTDRHLSVGDAQALRDAVRQLGPIQAAADFGATYTRWTPAPTTPHHGDGQ